MIYAKLDVCIPNHPKFIKAGFEAVGYWATCLAYTRGHDLSGFIPDEAVGVMLGKGVRECKRLAEKLVEIGLMERRDGGYYLANYDAKNETKEMSEARRESQKLRMRALRSSRHASPTELVRDVVPDSDSDSGSVDKRDVQKETLVGEGVLFPFDESRLVLTSERKAIAETNTTVQDVDATWQKFGLMAVEKNWRFDSRGWDARWQRFCLDEAKYQRVARERAAGWQGGAGNASLEASRSPSRKKLAPLQRPVQE